MKKLLKNSCPQIGTTVNSPFQAFLFYLNTIISKKKFLKSLKNAKNLWLENACIHIVRDVAGIKHKLMYVMVYF